MKIGLMGSQGTGKTSFMCYWTKKTPGWKQVSEVARTCPYPINEGTTLQSQEWMLKEQIRRELNYNLLDDFVVSDRTTLDHAAYIMRGINNCTIPYKEGMRLVDVAVNWAKTYDLIVFFPIMFDLKDDGVRSKSSAFQYEMDTIMRKLYKDYARDTLGKGYVMPTELDMEKRDEFVRGMVKVREDILNTF